MINPIKPSDISEFKLNTIPEVVIKSFNTLISKNFIGGSSTFLQCDVIEEIIKNDKLLDDDTIFKNRWLDIEPIYRNSGWKVTFDKPAYCETYKAFFTFVQKNNR